MSAQGSGGGAGLSDSHDGGCVGGEMSIGIGMVMTNIVLVVHYIAGDENVFLSMILIGLYSDKGHSFNGISHMCGEGPDGCWCVRGRRRKR